MTMAVAVFYVSLKKGEWNSCAAHQAMGLGGSSDRVGWERMPAFAKSVLLALTGSRKMEIKPITNQSPINHHVHIVAQQQRW